jgi:hypothetical protein
LPTTAPITATTTTAYNQTSCSLTGVGKFCDGKSNLIKINKENFKLLFNLNKNAAFLIASRTQKSLADKKQFQIAGPQ